jgi:predicted SAM-dependent methyltransferase
MTIKSSVKNRLGVGLTRVLVQLRFELQLMALHRRSARRSKRLLGDTPVKLNCGCGSVRKTGWINIDVTRTADLQLDLRKKLPFPDGSVSFIYSEHFFEHLEYPLDAETFLTESLRVLIPGGQFRVGVPDTEWPLNAYVNRDDGGYFEIARERWHPAYCNTKLHNINYHFRQGSEHKYAYDYETLAQVLSQAGFAKIEKSEFDPTLDSVHRKLGTLYANAFKAT